MELGVYLIHPDVSMPSKAYHGDVGIDFYSIEEKTLHFGTPTEFRTGLVLDIPDGYCIVLHDRSGLGFKGVKVLGGVIDSGYKGEVKICLVNLSRGTDSIKIPAKSKIAQGIILPVIEVDIVKRSGSIEEELPSERGTKGFGSSDNKTLC